MSQFRGSILLAAATLGGVLSARPASAAVLWRGDFETGTTKQWSYVTVPAQLKVVTAPVRAGKYALQISALKEGDRIEVQHGDKPAPEGEERFYAWSLMTPTPLTIDDHQTGYFESMNTYKQAMTFVINANDVFFDSRTTGGRRWTGRGLFTPGVWHDFILHVKWSQSATVGFIEIWFDNKKVLNQTMMPTMRDSMPTFFQIGFLSGHAGEILYLDEAVDATALADVMVGAPPVGGAGGNAGGAGGAAGSGGAAAGGRAGSSGGGGAAGSSGGTSAMGGTTGMPGVGGGSGQAGQSGAAGDPGAAGDSGAAGDKGAGGSSSRTRASGGCSLSVASARASNLSLLGLLAVALGARVRRARNARGRKIAS